MSVMVLDVMTSKTIRSVSFDTSFLLKVGSTADKIIRQLERDGVACFVTSTVISELQQLKVWGRIDEVTYKRAMSRWRRTNAKVIDFKNALLSSEFNRSCAISMGKHHGVRAEDIANDCKILVVGLKNGVDLFLSEDFHFTSRVTKKALEEITSKACSEYSQMCGEEMYSVNSGTFLRTYSRGAIDLDAVKSSQLDIKKPGKRMGEEGL